MQRRSIFALCLTALATLTTVGCPPQDLTPPATPTGLSAIVGNTQVTLNWNANTETDLKGYMLYWGTTSGTLSSMASVNQPTTTYTASGLTNGTTYYFALEAVDNANNKSAKTDEVPATPQPPDTTHPTATLTTPVNGATGVALDTNLGLSFSEDMDVGTVTVSLNPSSDLGDPTWNPENTLLTFDPPTNLSAEQLYSLTLSGKDHAGNDLTGTTSFSFTTLGTPPSVIGSSPSGSGVPVNTNLSLSFSEPMNRASVEGAFSSAPGITCAWAWTSDSTLATCDPTADLSFGTTYNVTLNTGAKDAAGNAITAPYSFSFTTASAPDTTKPTVTTTVPLQAANGVARSTNLSVTFSEPMDKASAQTAFQITSPVGVVGTFGWNPAGTVMTFNPASDFDYGITVNWQVSNAAKDLAGNTMLVSMNRSFQVIRQKIVDLISQAALDGHIYSSGQVYTDHMGLAVGDLSTNVFFRGFLSFDLTPLVTDGATNVTAATLYAYQYLTMGSPYTNLGNLRAESVSYGPSLEFADFETPTLTLAYTFSTSATVSWKSATVVLKVRDDYANRASRGTRSQFRLRFPTNTDADGVSDLADFYTGNAASNKPILRVTYEYP